MFQGCTPNCFSVSQNLEQEVQTMAVWRQDSWLRGCLGAQVYLELHD